jgi:hypothetical protein
LVDADNAELQRFSDAPYPRDIVTGEIGGKAIGRAVGKPYGFFLRGIEDGGATDPEIFSWNTAICAVASAITVGWKKGFPGAWRSPINSPDLGCSTVVN